jgi:hypothetical protein
MHFLSIESSIRDQLTTSEVIFLVEPISATGHSILTVFGDCREKRLWHRTLVSWDGSRSQGNPGNSAASFPRAPHFQNPPIFPIFLISQSQELMCGGFKMPVLFKIHYWEIYKPWGKTMNVFCNETSVCMNTLTSDLILIHAIWISSLLLNCGHEVCFSVQFTF